jgi:hypothetical protein
MRPAWSPPAATSPKAATPGAERKCPELRMKIFRQMAFPLARLPIYAPAVSGTSSSGHIKQSRARFRPARRSARYGLTEATAFRAPERRHDGTGVAASVRVGSEGQVRMVRGLGARGHRRWLVVGVLEEPVVLMTPATPAGPAVPSGCACPVSMIMTVVPPRDLGTDIWDEAAGPVRRPLDHGRGRALLRPSQGSCPGERLWPGV